ncbi:hypothetical protein DACRYDRAFT_18173 [Dacryopinax primogenitus]|uniref:YCII-related domain-containing protein n=1 Tax=Dacryopinax primogenitus (strain DJM 731) TaxID=1858805 RepID=M5FR21_DACPD|nr:uncharacterized protein DACRYDRAFT_18173 [Dacryopinax primogenitus]EJT98053.1 hypothetical protein DACRYDRAFT_18173 [Dacryopinax primogenitus]
MPAPLKRYLCYAPYFPDALPRREEASAAHKTLVAERASKGIMTLGGALLDEEGNVIGNCLSVSAPSLEEAKKLLEQDPYFTNKVWDPSQMKVTEWRQAKLI